ncbi:extracellular solute-binding protein [Aquisalimonas asiatica]|uniref:Iron(III) transport system substrate-binding protein n=1 Tax=Aquisalimonas asiatica TaxID=406100 RepID=A0A1H8RRG6_9GAMM|nr:extracellular solute-binding protein [Aquisalimonas asiatica]SEO69061.1 iron(III) transport system substrate-binding protein [Aquisalimonas asiatica]
MGLLSRTLPALLPLVFGLVAGCAGDDGDGDALVVYSAGPRPLAEAVIDDFVRETGVTVEFFGATTGQVMARLEAERYRPRADVVIFASEVAAEALKADDRLLRYQDPDWVDATEAGWHDPDGYYYATSAALVGMAVREGRHQDGLDWATVFDGDFQGRVTMPSPSRSGSAADFVVAYALSEEAMWADFLGLRRSGLDFAAANSQAISGLLVGTYDLILGAVDYLIYRQIADGAPVVMHYPPSGSAMVRRPIAIMAGTGAPDAARAFVDFYFTEPVQRRVADEHLLPARRDTEPSSTRGTRELPPLFQDDVEAALANQNRVLRRFQIEIERAEVVRGDD